MDYVWGDNESMINSSTIPEAKLNKRHNILSFHYVKSMISRGYINLQHIASECSFISTVSHTISSVSFLGLDQYRGSKISYSVDMRGFEVFDDNFNLYSASFRVAACTYTTFLCTPYFLPDKLTTDIKIPS